MLYMIFDISFSILSFFFFFFLIFTFSKRSFLGISDFWLKTPQNCKSCSKNGQNHQFALLSFTFHKKNPLFNVDLFPWTFDMASPQQKIHIFSSSNNYLHYMDWPRHSRVSDSSVSTKTMMYEASFLIASNSEKPHLSSPITTKV